MQRARASQASEVTVQPWGAFSSSWTSTLPFLPTDVEELQDGDAFGVSLLSSHLVPACDLSLCLRPHQLAPAW